MKYLPLDYQTVDEKTRKYAEASLNETDTNRDKCLKELKQMLKDEPGLTADTTDNFLLQFLRARKFNTENAFQHMLRYYKHKLNYSDMYRNHTPQNHQNGLDSEMMTFLPHRTADGCAVWAVRLGQWDPSKSTLEDVLKVGLMCQEQALKNPLTQICGVVNILDVKNLSWTHLASTSFSNLRCFVSATQDSFPIRHRAIHVLNNNKIFSALFAIVRPFLKEKIRNRFHFHGDDLSNLTKVLPAEMLPEEFGGTMKPFVNQQFIKDLLDSEEQFAQNCKLGYQTE